MRGNSYRQEKKEKNVAPLFKWGWTTLRKGDIFA